MTPGASAFTLTVTGTNFVQNSVVEWNGSARPTTYVSNTQLTAAISASEVASVGIVSISVTTLSPGGGASSNLSLTIKYPLPAIESLSPSGVVIGSGPMTPTVNGSNFVQGSTVYWNNIRCVTTFVSSTQLTASILAADTQVPLGTTASVAV